MSPDMSCRVPATPPDVRQGSALPHIRRRSRLSAAHICDVSVASHPAANPVPRTEATCESLDHAHPFTSAQRVVPRSGEHPCFPCESVAKYIEEQYHGQQGEAII